MSELLSLLRQGGAVAWCVVGALLVLSVLSWAVMGLKWFQMRAVRRSDANYLEAFRRSRNLKEAQHVAGNYPQGTLSALFREGYGELSKQSSQPQQPDASGRTDAPPAAYVNVAGLERALRRARQVEAGRLRKNLAVLATTASVSPFIGLFGTVWGIMNAFRQIGMQASASLAVVAPGIAEALVATAAGLAAAIPAVLGYNYFNARARETSSEMDNFALEFVNLVENIALRDGTLVK
ncbi:MAG: MotA/TolQ/ExbB proton channel family protein [Acidobacteriota bacterium]|nr:MAG: MotA/TolQ/ExbB proton channel family protein [Acidobacteriota bacterium]